MPNVATEPSREDQAAQRAKLIQDLGLTLDARFVPWSQSRNKNEKTPSLNWVVTLKRDGRPIIETDYMQGSGHTPAAKNAKFNRYQRREFEKLECETGKRVAYWGYSGQVTFTAKPIPAPKLEDVLYALLMDASAIDEGTFENWASSLGYDTDSRKAESIFKACIDIGLKLRAGLGEKAMADLRDAFQDY